MRIGKAIVWGFLAWAVLVWARGGSSLGVVTASCWIAGAVSGRALAGMLAVFAEFERDILRDRVKAGIAQARKEGRPHGRPPSAALHIPKIRQLFRKGVSKRQIAQRLGISRTSVRRLLGTKT